MVKPFILTMKSIHESAVTLSRKKTNRIWRILRGVKGVQNGTVPHFQVKGPFRSGYYLDHKVKAKHVAQPHGQKLIPKKQHLSSKTTGNRGGDVL